jgi:DNA replication protein DnaC
MTQPELACTCDGENGWYACQVHRERHPVSHAEPPPPPAPQPMDETLAAVLARVAPHFEPCTRCGQLTSGGGAPAVCWDCREKVERARRAREMLEGVIPPGFAWSNFAAPELARRCAGGEETVRRALGAVNASRVILVGASANGKTSLAVAMMRRWVERNRVPAHFVLATDLASARARAQLGRESSEVVDAMYAPLLVLDDLGTDSDIGRSAVTEVIFKRHAEQRPLWITTWLNPESAAKRYGDGIARRIFEGARIVECGGR